VQVEELRADIHRAFDAVSYPTTVKGMIAAPYRSSEDAHEMAVALLGKPWAAIGIQDLFRHREMLFTLAPAAYVAYLPAYLAASLATEDPFDKYGADLREYLLDTLVVADGASQDRTASTQVRLAELTAAQRAVVIDVVRHLAHRWNMPRAREILDELAPDHDRK
jgi:hypothetical protein